MNMMNNPNGANDSMLDDMSEEMIIDQVSQDMGDDLAPPGARPGGRYSAAVRLRSGVGPGSACRRGARRENRTVGEDADPDHHDPAGLAARHGDDDDQLHPLRDRAVAAAPGAGPAA